LQGEWDTPGHDPQDAERGERATHPFAGLRDLMQAHDKKHR
jgi:hypothetical protein